MQGFHRPIYTPSLEGVTLASDQGVAEDLRNAWETIFFQYEASPLPKLACKSWHTPPDSPSHPCSHGCEAVGLLKKTVTEG